MKLLVSDYDQTLAMDDISIWFNIKKINEFRNNGNKFMLSTGRTYESIKKEIDKYNIKYDFLSCVDGTLLYDSDDNLLECRKLDKEDFRKSQYLTLKYDKEVIINNIISDDSKLPEECVITIKKLNYFEDMQEIKRYFDYFLPNSEYSTRYNTMYLRHKNVNKSYAIKIVSEKLNLENSDIFTIGDHDNDVEMIRDYNGFTMLWGTKKAKEYATKQYLFLFQLINDIEKMEEKFVKKLKYVTN